MHPVVIHSERVDKYKQHEHFLDDALKRLEFPMDVKNLTTFVRSVNKRNLVEGGVSVNVYDSENGVIGPLTDITKNKKAKHIDLLYLKNKNNTHYCWIKDLWKLVGGNLQRIVLRGICAKCVCVVFLQKKY